MLTLTLYKILSTIGIPAILAGFVARSIKQKAYRHRFNERLGAGTNVKPGGIVIHGASVGEVLALIPFIEEVLRRFGDQPITITTFTPTGSEQVTRYFKDRVSHCYLPIDSPLPVANFLSRL